MERLTETIIGAAISVHKALGPGLLESAYQACMAYEMAKRGLHVVAQKPLPIIYGELRIDCAYRIDFLIEDRIIVELKAVERIERVHISQLLTYLKLSHLKSGILLNFNVPIMIEGIRRIYNKSLS